MEQKQTIKGNSLPLTDITSTVVVDSNITSIEKFVVKRNGVEQTLSSEKIRVRLEKLMEGLAVKHINLDLIINKTIAYA